MYAQDNKGKQPLWHGMKLALQESFEIEGDVKERSARTLSLIDINYIER